MSSATCRRCDEAPARVPFGPDAEFCIPCAVDLAEDTPVVVVAAACVVCGRPGLVCDGATGEHYCSADAATYLSTVLTLRMLEQVSA